MSPAAVAFSITPLEVDKLPGLLSCLKAFDNPTHEIAPSFMGCVICSGVNPATLSQRAAPDRVPYVIAEDTAVAKNFNEIY